MVWKLAMIWAVVAAGLALLFMPGPQTTVTIRVDLPPGAPPSPPAWIDTALVATWIVPPLLLIGVGAWLSWRVIKRSRL